jgi:glyoxylase-like metal-dependent hydrolase (beta-lactamase superfamily II)
MKRLNASRTCRLAMIVILGAPSMLAAQAATPPPPDPLVKANATVKVGPHTYVIPDGNVPLVPNVGIVAGSRATLVIDPGLGRRNGETVAREVGKLSKNSELFVTATHFHAEHTTGAIGLPAAAKFISPTIQESEFAQDGAPQIQLFSKRSPMTADLLKDAVAPKVAIRFEREDMLDLGGVRVRLLVVGPTHTRGDTAVFVEGDNVLFAGDVVMNNSFLAATQSTSMKAWLAAFDTFQSWRPSVIVPSHGPVGDGSLIAANRAVMITIQSRARELKAQGRSADEAAATIQKELQSAHPDWPRANGIAAAARSAYAEATP